MIPIYQRIRDLAEARKINQIELSEAIGCTKSQMNYYLNGKTKIVADHLPLFAKALRVPIAHLFDPDLDLNTLMLPERRIEKECEMCKVKDETISVQRELILNLKSEIERLKK